MLLIFASYIHVSKINEYLCIFCISYICEAVTRASRLLHKVKRKAEVWIIELHRKKNKLVFNVFLCIWSLYVCVCESTWEHTCAHMWRQKKLSGSLYFFLLYSPKKMSLTEPRAHHFSARMAASKPHGSSWLHLPSAVTIGAHAHAWLLMWLAAGYPNTGLHACKASALSSWTIFPISGIACIGFSLELDVKTLILKRPNALVTEYRDIILTLGWKPPPWWLAFIVPEGTIHPAWGKTHVKQS